MQDTVATQRVETKTDTKIDAKTKVFISYSRKDMEFADKLEAALKARGVEVLIDRQEIYAFEDWWKRIQALIGGADTVVFVLSPDSVKSEVALKEIAHAASLNKRFAPIVCRRVEDRAVPDALRRLNFIFFDDAERFEASADRLAQALETDIEWIRQHTQYGEAERHWSAAGRPNGLLLQSPSLEAAEHWLVSRPRGAPEPTEEIRRFVAASRLRARAAQRLRRIVQFAIAALLILIVLGLLAAANQDYLEAQLNWWAVERPYAKAQIWPYVLSAAKEQALKPGDSFKECTQDCPEMIVVPDGAFMMGSTDFETGHQQDEQPPHLVMIGKAFAVSKYEATFADWDACVAGGGCNGYKPFDMNWGRGRQPVVNVDWNDVEAYVAWLSQVTGKTYRLLTEAEYEYAVRAGTTTAYPWGNEVGENNANCDGCGSKWDFKQAAPVGSFAPNRFGLYDVVGNVAEWVQDCYHSAYDGAPADGSAWIEAGCQSHPVRGGGWLATVLFLRSAGRVPRIADQRTYSTGFRVARTLTP